MKHLHFILAFCVAAFLLAGCQTSSTGLTEKQFLQAKATPTTRPSSVDRRDQNFTAQQNQIGYAGANVKPSTKIAFGTFNNSGVNAQPATGAGATKVVAHARKPLKLKSWKKRRQKYKPMIVRHARAFGVPVNLALAIVEIESRYKPNARGRAGEIGLMQILPRTARYIGYTGPMSRLYDPNTNIRYGMKYLAKAHRLGGGSTCGTILKYNAGHGAKRMNKVTRKYCSRVRAILRR